jgi:bacillithiol system protein YtxJ
MRFLDRFTNSLDDYKNWTQVTSSKELKNLLLASNEHAQIVFKHSPSCGSSYYAKERLEKLGDPMYLESGRHIIDVIRHRSVSREFVEIVGVRHESPQIFIIRNGKMVWHASHSMIIPEKVLAVLQTK